MLNRTALIILVIAALITGGGIMLGSVMVNMANEITDNRVSAFSD